MTIYLHMPIKYIRLCVPSILIIFSSGYLSVYQLDFDFPATLNLCNFANQSCSHLFATAQYPVGYQSWNINAIPRFYN